MSITFFVTFLTLGAAVSALLTQAIKKAYANAGKDYSANVVALINSIVIGGLGLAAAYMLLGIQWTVNNIICLVIMVVAVWIGSMIGYDKVIQTAKQVAQTSADKSSEENTEVKSDD